MRLAFAALVIGLVGIAISYFLHGTFAVVGFGLGYIAGLFGFFGLVGGIKLIADAQKDEATRNAPLWGALAVVSLPIMFVLYLVVRSQPWPTKESFSAAITLVYCVSIFWVGIRSQGS